MRTKPPELIVVFNICGIGGNSNVQQYVKHIRNLLTQRWTDFRMESQLVISSCQNSHQELRALHAEFGDSVSYYITQENHPVNVTFNHACMLARQEFGMPKGFAYIDSGCDIGTDPDKLHLFFSEHVRLQSAMTAALCDTDTGFDLWRPGLSENDLFKNDIYEIPVGQTCNLHFQIFDRFLVEAFGRPMPDVFRDFCTESVFSFMCASVNKRFRMTRAVKVAHLHGMDGGASGFPDDRGWRSFLPQAPHSAEAIIADPEAKLCGMGYEECENVLMHDPACYDASGMVKDPARLQRFIAQNFFLPKSRFDYDKIVHLFVPQGKSMANYELPKEPFVPNIKEIIGRDNLLPWMARNRVGNNLVTGNAINAAKAHKSHSLDGVLLDVERDYRVMLESMDAWWRPVKRIGIMAGTDFHHRGFKFSPANIDPRNAIERWAEERHLVHHVCPDGTWVLLKRW